MRGTIAMAKVQNNPNSATSQFFFNLADNNSNTVANLDAQNGGFTVFGKIDDESMAVIDAVAGYDVFDLTAASNSAALSDVPLKDYSLTDATSGIIPGADNFIIINSATVTDAATDTASGLNIVANPNYNANPTNPGTGSSSSGGGGSLGAACVALLGLMGLRRRRV